MLTISSAVNADRRAIDVSTSGSHIANAWPDRVVLDIACPRYRTTASDAPVAVPRRRHDSREHTARPATDNTAMDGE
eukprot:191241-Rhodomonas_salina.2